MAKPLIVLVRLEGFGPPACGLEVRCSIQLSYRRKTDVKLRSSNICYVFSCWTYIIA